MSLFPGFAPPHPIGALCPAVLLAPPSGCSIDAMVGVLKDQERRLGMRILDNTPVWFVDGGEVKRMSRSEFRRLAEEGAVGPDTVVFDNTVTSLKEARSGRWEGPARASWHQRAFFRHSEQDENERR